MCAVCRLSKLHKKLDVLIKLFISSLGPSQALMLSRQATLGQTAAAGIPGAGTGGAFGSGIRSSCQASPPYYQGRGGLNSIPSLNLNNPGTPGGPGFLRHAMSALGQLPEQLAAVSGPLVHLGGHHGGGSGADRGLARRSGPPGLWGTAGAVGGGGTPTDRQGAAADFSIGISRAGSGTGGTAGTAGAGMRSSFGPFGHAGTRQAHGSEQHSPRVDDLRGSSFSGASGGSGGLHSLGSGHIGPMLAQVQALQLLNQQQHAGHTAAQLARARMVRPPGRDGLTRSNSL